MLKSIPVAFVIAMVSIQFSSVAVAQMQMTNLPWRIEEVLINPDLGAVLRSSDSSADRQAKKFRSISPERDTATALNQSSRPMFSNSSNQYRSPALADRDSLTARIQPTKSTPRLARLTENERASAADNTANSPQQQNSSIGDLSPEKRVDSNKQSLDFLSADELRELSKLTVRVTGATAMIESQAADLTVVVSNPTESKLGPVDVNVQVPDAITITRFDRKAWLDDERRIVAFRLDEIAPGKTEKIRLRGISHNVGKTSLRVLLTSGEQLLAGKVVDTQVFPSQLVKKYNFGDAQPEPLRK
jgi:hypothetical protein